jgi:quinolinate synthase
MKKTTLKDIYDVLTLGTGEIIVNSETAESAKDAIFKMMERS